MRRLMVITLPNQQKDSRGNNVSQGGADGNEGGVINLVLRSADRSNLRNINSAAQYVLIEIFYKFEGTSLATNVPADQSDRVSFGVNNNSYPALGGGLSHVSGRCPGTSSPIASA